MELVYRVTQIKFSDLGDFTNPAATVRVMPAGVPIWSAAFVEVIVKAPPALEASASPAQAAADAALQAARELLNEEALTHHLLALFQAEAAEQRQRDQSLHQGSGLAP